MRTPPAASSSTRGGEGREREGGGKGMKMAISGERER